ncbi:4591_t:CDS:2 [Ambispora gerdemannii]|uniref:4591_t:CDS:1 n=1 Tax=Ambispora gerdemannii TaxID=144530 RepID=A0A9N9BHB6_9GLOM|nr:4591_t:CDS:2 [Ambispora gerdemannii]
MPKEIDIADKPGFSYFITTPCEEWDALEYHEEWCASKHPINKATITVAITRQLEWFMKQGSEEEKKEANRMFKQFKEGVKAGGYIDDFWIKMDLERKINLQEIKVSAEVRKIQSDKCLIMNKRSLDVLKETVVEHNEASALLGDFARDGQDVRKRRKQYHQLDGYTTPSPDIIIDDIPCGFSFKNGDPVDDLHVGETNVSLLFRNYQNQSLNIARDKGLFVESNVQEILSLSSILLLASNSYSNTMIDHFGLSLLDEIHQKFKSEQQIVLDSNSETTFRKAVKMAMGGSRDDAIIWLCGKLSSEQSLRENLGFIILDCLRVLPSSKIRNEHSEITHYTNFLDRIMKGLFDDPDKHVVQWPNTALNESKTRKAEGRAKQPDFTTSIICQLQTSATLFVGEVSPPSKRGDVYKNCNDLIRLGVFMKDILDSSVDKGADIKCWASNYKVDYYTMDLVQGIYIMIHIGQMLVPASLKDMSSFVDDIELSLRVQDIFRKSYENFYTKLCNPGSLTKKATFKRETLCTPKFRQLVSKTHDVNRSCPFWFGRF